MRRASIRSGGRYAPDGSVVCVPCGERLATEQKKVATKSAGSAFGGGTAYSALTNPLSREPLGWKRIPTIVVGARSRARPSSLLASFSARTE
jgi:hypothetical protein